MRKTLHSLADGIKYVVFRSHKSGQLNGISCLYITMQTNSISQRLVKPI